MNRCGSTWLLKPTDCIRVPFQGLSESMAGRICVYNYSPIHLSGVASSIVTEEKPTGPGIKSEKSDLLSMPRSCFFRFFLMTFLQVLSILEGDFSGGDDRMREHAFSRCQIFIVLPCNLGLITGDKTIPVQ